LQIQLGLPFRDLRLAVLAHQHKHRQKK
jgi:hypothetical protein